VKSPVIAFPLVLVGGMIVALAQPAADARLQAQLKQLFPAATSFSPKEGELPHFKAFITAPGASQPGLAGVVFWTTELQPLERGYDGPIKILVGMDTKGILTGVIVVEHREPYGNFSIEPPAFAAQFKNKNIRDTFRVGDDIDAVSTATLSITSATRAIRNGARRLARQLLAPEGPK
jgi:NosR/NirI family nitrous oxide reductase transcriptional regulator